MVKNRKTIRAISAMVLVCFLHQQLAWPQPGAPVLPMSGQAVMQDAPAVAGGYAHVTDKNLLGDTDELIFTIRDNHASLSAQYSIVGILSDLYKNYELELVSIEGAAGYVDTSLLRSLPDADIRRSSAELLMQDGLLSAGEFFSVINDKEIALYGAEEEELYRENVELFKEVHSAGLEPDGTLEELIVHFRTERESLFPEDLNRLLFRKSLHDDGKLSLQQYWRYLRDAARQAGLELEDTGSMGDFLRTAALERDVDFREATRQREALLNDIMSVSSRAELKEMVAYSLSYKEGKSSKAAYHKWLMRLAAEKGIETDRFDQLNGYLDYVRSYYAIDIFALKNRLDREERRIIEAFLSTDEQKRLYDVCRFLDLLRALFLLNLSRGDVREVKKALQRTDLLAHIESRIKAGGDLAPDVCLSGLTDRARRSLRFYETAHRRDAAMLERTIAAMRSEGKKVGALITGGHHTEGLLELMRDRQVSYMVFTPDPHENIERPYVAVITRDREAYEGAARSARYELAVEAFFNTGDLEKLERAIVYAAGKFVLKGEDLEGQLGAWVRAQEEVHSSISPQRKRAAEGELVDPREFREYVRGIRAERLDADTVRVSVAGRVYDVSETEVRSATAVAPRQLEGITGFVTLLSRFWERVKDVTGRITTVEPEISEHVVALIDRLDTEALKALVEDENAEVRRAARKAVREYANLPEHAEIRRLVEETGHGHDFTARDGILYGSVAALLSAGFFSVGGLLLMEEGGLSPVPGSFIVAGVYLAWAAMRYLSLGRAVLRRMREHEGRLPVMKALRLPIAASYGYRHKAFDLLSPREQHFVILHEKCRTHFFGMVSLLPGVRVLNTWLGRVTPLKWQDRFWGLRRYLRREREEPVPRTRSRREKKKVLLIASPIYHYLMRESGRTAGYFIAPPYGLYRMKAYLEGKGLAEVTVFDPNLYPEDAREGVGELLRTKRFDVIGFSLTHENMQEELELIELAREITGEIDDHPAPLMLAGGNEATQNTEQWLEEAWLDAIVLGFGERALEEIISVLPEDSNELSKDQMASIHGIAFQTDEGTVRRPARPVTAEDFRELVYRNEPMKAIPYGEYWEYNAGVYQEENLKIRDATLKAIRMFTSSHCLNACGFCSSWNYLQSATTRPAAIRYLSGEEMFELLCRAHQEHHPEAVFFNDDDIIIDRRRGKGTRERMLRFCRLVRDAKREGELPAALKLYAQTKARNVTYKDTETGKWVADTELLQAMREAGFIMIALGIESFSDRMLSAPSVNKKVTAERSRVAVDGMLAAGIEPLVNILMLPVEITRKDFITTADVIVEYVRRGAQLSLNPLIEYYPGAFVEKGVHSGRYECFSEAVYSRRTSRWSEIAVKLKPDDPEMRLVAENLETERKAVLRELASRPEWGLRYPPQLINGLISLMAAYRILASFEENDAEKDMLNERCGKIEKLVLDIVRTPERTPAKGPWLTVEQMDHLARKAMEILSSASPDAGEAQELFNIAQDLYRVRPHTHEKIMEYALGFLERLIVGEEVFTDNEAVTNILAQALARSDYAPQRVERVLALLNFHFGIKTPILRDYDLDGKETVTFVKEGPVLDRTDRIKAGFADRRVMIFEPHHDDAAAFLGNILETKMLPAAAAVSLVTVLSDPEGVTDEYARRYAEEHGLHLNADDPESMCAVKDLIRSREGKAFAAQVGIAAEDYIELQGRSHVARRAIDATGHMLSYHSVFSPLGKGLEARALGTLETWEPDILVIPYPRGSYHQHHRDVSRLLLSAIVKYDRRRHASGKDGVAVFLYAPNIDGNGFFAYGIEPNLYNYFSGEESARKRELLSCYVSQLQRERNYERFLPALDIVNARVQGRSGTHAVKVVQQPYAETLLKVRVEPAREKDVDEAVRERYRIEMSVSQVMQQLRASREQRLRVRVLDGHIFYETGERFGFLDATADEVFRGDDDPLREAGVLSLMVCPEKAAFDWSSVENDVHSLLTALAGGDRGALENVLKSRASIVPELFSPEGARSAYEFVPASYLQADLAERMREKGSVTVAIHQPGYHRYLGFFAKMKRSDIFILEDEVQYEKQEWQNRQAFRDPGSAKGERRYLTVPMEAGPSESLIKEKTIAEDGRWRRDHWRAITEAYGGEPYFEEYEPFLREFYKRRWRSLSDMTEALTRFVAKTLDIEACIIRASQLGGAEGHKGARISELVEKAVGREVLVSEDAGVAYLSGRGALGYLQSKAPDGNFESDKITKKGIRLLVQEFPAQVIRERWEVEPYAPMIEILFELGPASREVLEVEAGMTVLDRSVSELQNAAMRIFALLRGLEKEEKRASRHEAWTDYYIGCLAFLHEQIAARCEMRDISAAKTDVPVVLIAHETLSELKDESVFAGLDPGSEVIIMGRHAREWAEKARGYLQEDPRLTVHDPPSAAEEREIEYELMGEHHMVDLGDEMLEQGPREKALERSAMVIMASGAGTRLAGVAGMPFDERVDAGLADIDLSGMDEFSKSLIPLTRIMQKSPLQLLLEQLAAISRQRDVAFPVVIVCNPSNKDDIEKLLIENEYFGFKELILTEDAKGPPVFDNKGRVIIREHEMKHSGGGTGGTLKALGLEGFVLFGKEERQVISRLTPLEHLGRLSTEDLYFFQCDMPYSTELLEGLFTLMERDPAGRDMVALCYDYPPPKGYKPGVVVGFSSSAGEGYEVVEHRDWSRKLSGLMQEVRSSEERKRVPAYAGALGVSMSLARRVLDAGALRPYIHWDKLETDAEGNTVRVNKFQYSLTDLFKHAGSVAALMVPFDKVLPAKDPAKLAEVRGALSKTAKERLRALGAGHISADAVVEISPLASLEIRAGETISISDSARVYFGGAAEGASRISIGRDVSFEDEVGVYFTGGGEKQLGAGVAFRGEGKVFLYAPAGEKLIVPANEVLATTRGQEILLSPEGRVFRQELIEEGYIDQSERKASMLYADPVIRVNKELGDLTLPERKVVLENIEQMYERSRDLLAYSPEDVETFRRARLSMGMEITITSRAHIPAGKRRKRERTFVMTHTLTSGGTEYFWGMERYNYGKGHFTLRRTGEKKGRPAFEDIKAMLYLSRLMGKGYEGAYSSARSDFRVDFLAGLSPVWELEIPDRWPMDLIKLADRDIPRLADEVYRICAVLDKGRLRYDILLNSIGEHVYVMVFPARRKRPASFLKENPAGYGPFGPFDVAGYLVSVTTPEAMDELQENPHLYETALGELSVGRARLERIVFEAQRQDTKGVFHLLKELWRGIFPGKPSRHKSPELGRWYRFCGLALSFAAVFLCASGVSGTAAALLLGAWAVPASLAAWAVHEAGHLLAGEFRKGGAGPYPAGPAASFVLFVAAAALTPVLPAGAMHLQAIGVALIVNGFVHSFADRLALFSSFASRHALLRAPSRGELDGISDLPVLVGLPARIYDELHLSSGAFDEVLAAPGVKGIVRLESVKRPDRMDELARRAARREANGVLIGEDVLGGLDAEEYAGAILVLLGRLPVPPAVRHVPGREAGEEVAGKLFEHDTDKLFDGAAGTLAFSERDWRDIEDERVLRDIVIQLSPESVSYHLTERSYRQIKLTRTFEKSVPEKMPAFCEDARGERYLVHFADGAKLLSGEGPLVVPPGLEIERRRRLQGVRGADEDRLRDVICVTVPPGREKSSFRRQLMDMWMLEGVIPDEDLILLEVCAGELTTGRLLASVRESTRSERSFLMDSLNTGILCLNGVLAHDVASYLQVGISPEAKSNVKQYDYFLKRFFSMDDRPAGRRVFMYLPASRDVVLERELEEYRIYFKKILTGA